MYVGHGFSQTVNIIDTSNNQVAGTVTVGQDPINFALAGTGMYVANSSSNNVNIIDIRTHQVAGTISVGSSPLGLALAGTGMYVANNNNDNVNIIDITTNQIAGTIAVGDGPIALARAGTGMYVTNNSGNTVSVIDITTNQVVQTIPVGTNPKGLALAGTGMYIANSTSDNVNIIDITTHQIAGTITVGDSPNSLALAGTGMYVTNETSNNVNIIDITTNQIAGTIAVGNAPNSLALAGTGMYVTNLNDGTVNIIDITTNQVAGTVSIGSGPRGLAFDAPPPPPPSPSPSPSPSIATSNPGMPATALPSFVIQTATRSLATHLRQSQNFFAFQNNESRPTAMLVSAKRNIPCRLEKKQPSIDLWGLNTAQYANLEVNNHPSFGFFSDTSLLGIDYQTPERKLIGGMLGYAHIHDHRKDNGGHGNSNIYMGSIYTDLFFDHLYFSPGVLGAFGKTDQMRNVHLTDFDAKAHANIFAWFLDPHLELGYEVVLDKTVLVPFSLLDWTFAWQRSYQEHGASPYDESVPSQAASLLRSETGLRAFQHFCHSWGDIFLIEKASYVLEKPFNSSDVQTGFVGSPDTFTIAYTNQILNLGAVGFDVDFSFGKKNPTHLRVGIEGEAGSKYWSCEGTIELGHKF
jgi:YVTN family beta-propeller protein